MISVLLATYNGEKYLAEQLDSLLSQTFQDFKIFIRDDGSSDGTAVLIKDYAVRFPEKINIISGERSGGACANFFELIKAVDDDYIMFCDQDDFWLPKKIEKTFDKIRQVELLNPDKPILIHSDLKVVDGKLNIINDSFFSFQRISPERKALNQLLPQNNVTGCTVMINRALLKLAKTVPQNCAMHDWWLALIASAFGAVDYISEPLMLYRQHGNNEVGAKSAKGLSLIARKLKSFKKTAQNYSDTILQAKSFFDIFGENLSEKDREIVKAYISLSKLSRIAKIKLIKKYDFRKNTLARTLGQYILI